MNVLNVFGSNALGKMSQAKANRNGCFRHLDSYVNRIRIWRVLQAVGDAMVHLKLIGKMNSKIGSC